MTMEKKGLVKLTEECGELVQVASKKMARMDDDEHWDGKGSLSHRLEDEIADVIASSKFVTYRLGLNWGRIEERVKRKTARFATLDIDNSL